jgi:hypothetical protein
MKAYLEKPRTDIRPNHKLDSLNLKLHKRNPQMLRFRRSRIVPQDLDVPRLQTIPLISPYAPQKHARSKEKKHLQSKMIQKAS